jgi:galactonate dehydratase
LPSGPGLGLTLNEDFVREHPMQDVNFNLFAEGWQRREHQAALTPS